MALETAAELSELGKLGRGEKLRLGQEIGRAHV
jgi:hypothetical protein